MKFNDFLGELEELDLPEKEYAIFGSGPLAIRGLRDSSDLDIIVKENLWKELSKKYNTKNLNGGLQVGNIEIYHLWFGQKIDKLIDSAEEIIGYKFVKLEYVLEWKKKIGRDKDKADIELIKKFLKIN